MDQFGPDPNRTYLPGVQIGDGSILAANSVGTRDIPPYAWVAEPLAGSFALALTAN